MSEAQVIVAEIIIGIVVIGILSAVITVVMVRVLPSRRSPAAEALDLRYASGELSREQYRQMCEELGLRHVAAPHATRASQAPAHIA